MFQHVDMKKKPYILQNLICGLQENSNLISVVIKMFQHNNVGMDKFLSIAKSYLWPLVWLDQFDLVSAVTKIF